MVDQIRSFLENGDWKQIEKKHEDFTSHKQNELRSVMKTCSTDTEYSLDKPYDLDHENFKWFALCLRNNTAPS